MRAPDEPTGHDAGYGARATAPAAAATLRSARNLVWWLVVPVMLLLAVLTLLQCASSMAPGWKAVIWLSSMSVVMNACAV